jgi:hypothetical protein
MNLLRDDKFHGIRDRQGEESKRKHLEKQGQLTLSIVTMTGIGQLELTTGHNVESCRQYGTMIKSKTMFHNVCVT